jgi:hypothetical protein
LGDDSPKDLKQEFRAGTGQSGAMMRTWKKDAYIIMPALKGSTSSVSFSRMPDWSPGGRTLV